MSQPRTVWGQMAREMSRRMANEQELDKRRWVGEQALVVGPRGAQKTTRLIGIAEKAWAYIACCNRQAANFTYELAMRLGKQIPMPITHDELRQPGAHPSTQYLIDDANYLLHEFARSHRVIGYSVSGAFDSLPDGVYVEAKMQDGRWRVVVGPLKDVDPDYEIGRFGVVYGEVRLVRFEKKVIA